MLECGVSLRTKPLQDSVPFVKQASRKRFQFRLRHLLVLMLFLVVVLSIFAKVAARLGYRTANVEMAGSTDDHCCPRTSQGSSSVYAQYV